MSRTNAAVRSEARNTGPHTAQPAGIGAVMRRLEKRAAPRWRGRSDHQSAMGSSANSQRIPGWANCMRGFPAPRFPLGSKLSCYTLKCRICQLYFTFDGCAGENDYSVGHCRIRLGWDIDFLFMETNFLDITHHGLDCYESSFPQPLAHPSPQSQDEDLPHADAIAHYPCTRLEGRPGG